MTLKTYHFIVFCVSAVCHYVALCVVLWYGQFLIDEQHLLWGEYRWTKVDVAVVAAVSQTVMYFLLVSPIGSMIENMRLPFREMSKREAGIVMPVLDEMMGKYKMKAYAHLKKVRVLVLDETDVNAYAFGRNTIVLTKSFINKYQRDKETMAGVMAHELGHLHHRDLQYWNSINATGGMLSLIDKVLGYTTLGLAYMADKFMLLIFISIPMLFVYWAFKAALFVICLPIKIFVGISEFNSTKIEYRADKFAAELVGVKSMARFLEHVVEDETFTETGFMAMQRRSHPPSEFRLEKLYDFDPMAKDIIDEERSKIKKHCKTLDVVRVNMSEHELLEDSRRWLEKRYAKNAA